MWPPSRLLQVPAERRHIDQGHVASLEVSPGESEQLSGCWMEDQAVSVGRSQRRDIERRNQGLQRLRQLCRKSVGVLTKIEQRVLNYGVGIPVEFRVCARWQIQAIEKRFQRLE